jgi:hypothetical protein
MKTVLSLFALVLAALSQAQVHLKLQMGGQSVGTAVLTQKVSATQINQKMHIALSFQGNTGSQDIDTVNDRLGRVLRETMSQSIAGHVASTTVVYGAKEVKVSHTENGKTTVKSVAVPKGNLADSSTLWFITQRPKKGASVTYLSFDARALKWKTRTAHYVGDEKVAGTSMTGHHVHHEDGDIWLDDKGFPIRLEDNSSSGKIVLTRE